ncbi:ricin-type beta-trefoil lectin domain protein [Arthrobacter sedimenti]|uniref:ricin-type beta-trefoil lectin domain protein n=1 Tax=Arthrobacter sedimenti TaxID=2694931 RepID=UPI0014219FF6|nr:GH32 C-terminal domain-containing protein [Arthrobacter sedimenti]
MKEMRMAVVTVFALVLALFVPTAGALAGTPDNYAEYPYAATDYNEPFRGQFHFSSQNGWMNDINAPLYYNGQYHLFYQHNPHGLDWDTMHWGHATSTDMVHWQQKPIALEPGVHNSTLFSGGGWVDTNNVTGLRGNGQAPIILFTNTNGVSIAYSNDGGNRFQMYNGGAKVITTAYESRDPKVFWDAARNRWGMALWANDGGNTVKFYSSTNLLNWIARGEFRADWIFECADIFQLPVDGNTGNQKWVITDASGEYSVGSLNSNGVFVQDAGFPAPQRMDQGRGAFDGSFYAGLTFTNLPTNRVVQMYWQPGNKGTTWTGNASFPAELGLKTFPEGIRTTRVPIPEISTLRSGTQSWGTRTITTSDSSDPLNGVNADTYELIAEWDLNGATATEFGFRLHQRADGSSDRTIAYNRPLQQMEWKPLAPINNRIKMRILVDRGQVEAFGNDGKFSLTENTDFNSASNSLGISTYAQGGNVTLTSLTFHRLGKAFTAKPSGPGVTAGQIRWNGTNKCLDRDPSGTVNIWDCNENLQQSWIYDSVNGQLKVGGNCLDQPIENIGNGAGLNAWKCNQQDQQRWTRQGDGQFRNAWSGRCVDLAGGDATNGRRLQVWDCAGGPNQRFTGV